MYVANVRIYVLIVLSLGHVLNSQFASLEAEFGGLEVKFISRIIARRKRMYLVNKANLFQTKSEMEYTLKDNCGMQTTCVRTWLPNFRSWFPNNRTYSTRNALKFEQFKSRDEQW